MVQYNVPNCFSNDCDCAGTPPSGNFSCSPSACLESHGTKCCCCSSIDIVLNIRARCYDRVYFSCNRLGTSPGPGEDPFPAECVNCFDACDRAMGGDVACASISNIDNDYPGPPPDWYDFPSEIGPCECDCETFVDPGNPGEGCELTCVKCPGLSCNANVEVIAADCSYQFNLTPGTGCCGTPALTDVVFAIDYSISMDARILSVIASASDFADSLALTGGQARFGLLVYGNTSSCVVESGNIQVFSNGENLTENPEEFKQFLNDNLPTTGGVEPDFMAAGVALQTYPWGGVENILFLIGDEPIDNQCGPPVGGLSDIGNPALQPSAASLIDFANTLGVRIFTLQPFDGGIGADVRKTELSLGTSGGQDLDITVDFGDLLDDINLNVFGASCSCLDTTPTPIELCRGGVGPSTPEFPEGECIDPDVNIPIGMCIEEDNSDCGVCNDPLTFNVCDEIVVVEPDPDTVKLVCCGALSGGCTCPTTESEEGCCGVICADDICPPVYATKEAAIEGVWCACYNHEFAIVETSGCLRCTIPDPSDPDYDNYHIPSLENCTIKLPDGAGGYTSFSRSQIETEVTAAWAACEDVIEPPPSIPEATCLPECDRQDQAIGSQAGCISSRNPDTIILNNGIGLVAYESMKSTSVIKIKQFNTSLPGKILPNRRTNYGRLQNTIRWESMEDGFKIVKLYYFEALPTHFIDGLDSPPAEDSFTDTIIFRNGPFQNQCFSLYQQTVDIDPVGTDEVGDFIRFTVPDDTVLSNDFPSLDDVYNIEWFILDSDDTGLIGSAAPDTDVPGSDFLLDVNAVNVNLELSPHIHDGQPVPVSYPSISTAHNYMNATENSHYVYLVYQALENQKWNLYMRQLRLSEYSREKATTSSGAASTISLQSLGITELMYRAVCVTDVCDSFGNDFLTKRTVTFEVLLADGREVFNEELLTSTESWTVCPGEPAGSFLKKKVVMEFVHSTVTNRCPNQFEFNEIFYNWEVGDEFSIPHTNLTSDDMFELFSKPNDSAIDLGEETVQVSGITVTSSHAAAIWYEDSSEKIWATIDDTAFQNLLRFKGLDVSEPILITEFEEGHCTHPVVSVNSNNEIFVIYECTDPQVHQIHIIGTVAPSSSLPMGVFTPKNLDANLNYFLSPNDFKYRNAITLPGDGINQLPDTHIDVNDVIHIAWQSNRDNYWEIYYANSEDQFNPKRITNFKSKSLKPSVSGDTLGNLHIAWHDNRFDSWEIMMAHRDDERVLTLIEQDPYLASVRNTGYSHSTDIIPLNLKNNGDTVLCVSNLFVRFLNDRLLTQSAFDVFQSEFPIAFQIPGMEEDRATVVVSDLSGWEPGAPRTIQGDSGTMYSPSDGFDTALVGSYYDTINLVYAAQPLYIRFAAGETPIMDLTDPNTSWEATAWISASTLVSGTATNADDLILNYNTNIPEGTDPTINSTPHGRYKKMFVILPADLLVSSIEVVSVIKDRVCIAPGETVTGYLDVTPFIRVDGEGNETVETPISVGINRNQVYFISVIAIQDNGQIYVFEDQKRSVSCEICVNDSSPWNSAACVYAASFLNVSSEQKTKFFNARFRFYTDQELENLVAQFDAFGDSEGDLEYISIDDNRTAQSVWTDAGLEVFFGKSRTITLWPMLSNTSGLLCGVRYWVTTEVCSGTIEDPCTRLSLEQTRLEKWICNCGSSRWEERYGDAPINIRDTIRWASSGDGFSDTRLTETGIGIDNYNPVIRLRTDLTGIVVYESNRDDPNPLTAENKIHTLYGTAFSVFPRSNMYATGAESINTQFGEVLIRSDIPITACNGTDCQEDLAVTGPAIEGRNADFALDQYDNLFLAAEQLADQTDCVELREDFQRTIIVHRCGMQAKHLAFTSEEQEGAGTFACDPSEILGKTAPLSQDVTFRKLIKLVRVNNEFAKYHITRSKRTAAVIDQCDIRLDVITEPDTVAIRIKNENEAKSTWFPFDPDLGRNTISVPWTLSAGSGVKNVTIEAATYQGLSASFTLPIIADYKGVDHTVKFYKFFDQDAAVPSIDGTSYDDLIGLLIAMATETDPEKVVFAPENLLQNLEGVPVAGIRQPDVVEGSVVNKTGEFIYVEIIPTQKYLEDLGILESGPSEEEKQRLLPTFDVLQQGAQDLFSVPTIFDESNMVFKGVFPVQKENKTFYKDGLSFVILHFQKDCGDLSTTLLSTGEYARDQFNLVIPGGRTAPEEAVNDVWANERSAIGTIKSQVDIRGLEDPYFVFGDPNYRLKKQDE